MTPAQLKFLKIVTKEKYFAENSKILLALSGGKDSMTLFNWLYELRAKLHIELGIAHINHGLRPESDFEEQALRKMASDLGIPIFVDRFTGEFTEQKAREFRYHFFEKIMIAENYDVLLTAHHQGDVVETVLMRQITGRPLRSLQGIADCQPFAKGQLIRPLLKFTKEELDAAVFYEDSTNQGVDYFRNRIRNQLIPELTKENPQFSQAISDLSSEIKMALTVINQKISELEIVDEKISYHKFISQTKELQHFILQAFFAQYPEIKVSKKKFEEILHIIRRPQQYSAQLNKDFQFVKTKDYFYIEKRQLITASIEILSENPNDASFMEVYLPLEGQLEIRKRQPGDQILINGHHKKLRKFFIDNHVPLQARENPLIFVEKKLYAIVGVACSDLSKELKNDKIRRILWVKPSIGEEINDARKKS